MKDNEIKWNSALDDLQLLSQLEKEAIESNLNNDLENYYKFLKAYFQKLTTIVDIEDRNDYITVFDSIELNLYSNLKINKEFEEWQRINSSIMLGRIRKKLEEIYYRLTKIKVNAGLSVQKIILKEAVQNYNMKKTKAGLPILELK